MTAYVETVGSDERPDGLRAKVHDERVIYDNKRVSLTRVGIEPPDGRRSEPA